MNKLFIPLVVIALTMPTIVLSDGQADFKANCLMCHGGSAKTNQKRALMLKIDATKLYLAKSEMNREGMIAIINKGKGKMPGFENKLTKDQIAGLVDYIQSLQKK
jgi:mono/diheme cytochrome c family protein